MRSWAANSTLSTRPIILAKRDVFDGIQAIWGEEVIRKNEEEER
jgi:hypothetical protein